MDCRHYGDICQLEPYTAMNCTSTECKWHPVRKPGREKGPGEKPCTRCGWCCMHVKMKVEQRFSKVDAAWMAARGIVLDKGMIIIPSVCPQFRVDRAGFPEEMKKPENSCRIYENRPLICRVSGCPK